VTESLLNGKIELHCGDCLSILPTLAKNSIDACVTDPPYHLISIVKRFGGDGAAPAQFGKDGAYARASAGFMGKQWDGGDIAFRPEVWREVYRVLKPGAHLLAFGGTRTYHRLACAIEDAGFEIRDQLAWVYGQGFPKSRNLDGDWSGWGTALKPAWEPIVLARKPLVGTVAENVLKHGTGALNIDGTRIEATESIERLSGINDNVYGADNRRSMIRGSNLGRWPANLIHDGSEEVLAGFPDSNSGSASGYNWDDSVNDNPAHVSKNIKSGVHFGDSGSAARFFYTAKADKDERLGSKHPTVKPLDLMQYLVRLVCPKGGTVLDPFSGTGTTGEAAFREGMRAILIEREAEYQADIRRRMALVLSGPDERAREAIKERMKGRPPDHGPLFASDWDSMWARKFDYPERI
jgi:site-specific DNA-methyltransferase (adenine-specific)